MMQNSVIKLAFIGDSITEGCFEFYPCSYGFETVRRPEDGYAEKTVKALRKKYGEPAITYRNFAKSGYSAHTAGPLCDEMIQMAPDIAVVCFGLNDALHPEKRFEIALSTLFERLLPVVSSLIFVTPNMMNTYVHPDTLPCAHKLAKKTMAVQTDGKFDRMMQTAKMLCHVYGIQLCDVYSYWKRLYDGGADTTELLVNHINHPTAQMHDIAAAMLTETLDNL